MHYSTHDLSLERLKHNRANFACPFPETTIPFPISDIDTTAIMKPNWPEQVPSTSEYSFDLRYCCMRGPK